MPLVPYAQVSLTELKAFMGVAGDTKDQELEGCIALASQDVEEEGLGGRRVVYRGPIESLVNVMAQATLANGDSVPAIAGQPNSSGRTLVVTKVDADRGISAGTLTVTGTVGGVAGSTETFDLTAGNELHGVKFFTAISALALTGVAGAGGGDSLKIGTSPGYTEFYSPCDTSEITPIEWPIQNVIEVNEDINRTFPTTTALTAVTQYEIREGSSARRRIARVSSSLDFGFYSGYRVVRVRYSAGYKTQATVPQKIKSVCLELAAWYFQHSDRRQYGLTSISDATGSRSFSGPPVMTSGLSGRLAAYVRPEFEMTADRDFVLEPVS
jgi:hypothetical protein